MSIAHSSEPETPNLLVSMIKEIPPQKQISQESNAAFQGLFTSATALFALNQEKNKPAKLGVDDTFTMVKKSTPANSKSNSNLSIF